MGLKHLKRVDISSFDATREVCVHLAVVSSVIYCTGQHLEQHACTAISSGFYLVYATQSSSLHDDSGHSSSALRRLLAASKLARRSSLLTLPQLWGRQRERVFF